MGVEQVTEAGADFDDLEECAQQGRPPRSDRRLRVRVDDEYLIIDDAEPTGLQLLLASGKRPPEEHLIFQVLPGGLMEELRLEETVDLRRVGIERFVTFEASASYRFMLDGVRLEWGGTYINGRTLKKLAGKDLEKYTVWLEVRGGEDREIKDNDRVDLSEEGLERFFTALVHTTAGSGSEVLPNRDREYLTRNAIQFEEVEEGSSKAVILRRFSVGSDRLDNKLADVLIQLPAGYPDTPPDMFYCLPWLKLVDCNRYPDKADQALQFAGQRWQRWSRHNSEWRPGVDGIWTMLKRVQIALKEAA